MKKILAALLAIASVLSLSACQDEGNGTVTDPADANVFQSNEAMLEAEQSNAIAESIAEADEIQDETYDKYIKKVGKTKKNAQLVVEVKRSEEDIGREFWKFEFKKNGEFDTKIEYHFLATREKYNAKVQIAKDVDGLKVIEKDKDANLVVIKNDKFNGKSFDKMYENYKNEAVAEKGYIVIE